MNNLSDRKGAALVISMMVMGVIGLLGMALSVNGVNESRMAQRRAQSVQAFWLTEAGLQAAFRDIATNDCKGLRVLSTQAACASCAACTGTNVITGTLRTGGYTVTLTNSNQTLVSTGACPSTAAPVAQRRVQATLSTASAFAYAAFAQGQMTFSNNAKVDSFNSANGAYGGANVGSDGNIGTNGTGAGIISLSNNVSIKGSASTGANGTVTTSNGATISGTTTHANHVTLLPVSIPAALSSLASGGVLSIGGHASKTLSAGDYK